MHVVLALIMQRIPHTIRTYGTCATCMLCRGRFRLRQRYPRGARG